MTGICAFETFERRLESTTLTGHSFDDANGPARQESRSLMARQKACAYALAGKSSASVSKHPAKLL